MGIAGRIHPAREKDANNGQTSTGRQCTAVASPLASPMCESSLGAGAGILTGPVFASYRHTLMIRGRRLIVQAGHLHKKDVTINIY